MSVFKIFLLTLFIIFSGCGGGSSVNHPPIAFNENITVKVGESVVIPFKAKDPDGDHIKFMITRLPKNGEFNKDTLTYTPYTNFSGYDELDFYVVDDKQNRSNDAKIIIKSQNDLPPTISLIGSSQITIGLGEQYSDAGASANDLEDGDISDSIIKSGNVDTTKYGIYAITYSVTDSKGHKSSMQRKVIVRDDKYQVDFDGIRELFKNGEATYICVGDSTRAQNSEYDNGDIYQIVSTKLKELGNTTHIEAQPGHRALEWDREVSGYSWRDTANLIPSDGSNTVVNISLGINDVKNDEITQDQLRAKINKVKNSITSAIDKIKSEKPNTIFMLTMPNRLKGYDNQNIVLYNTYTELAQERGYPLINTIDEIFINNYGYDMYRDADAQDYGEHKRIHLSHKAQKMVADLILAKIASDVE